jgi:DNA-binding FadR family transcriptional regulator
MSLQRAQDEDPRMGELGTTEHRRFVQALSNRDVAAATEVMSVHLARTAERVRGLQEAAPPA